MSQFKRPQLSLTEAGHASSIGHRLRSSLKEALFAIETEGPTSVRSLAHQLGIDRNVCQRIKSGVEGELTPLETLVRLPGIDGLRSFALSLESTSVQRRTVEEVNSAVDQFAEFLQATRRTHSNLVQAISGSRGSAGGSVEEHLGRRNRILRRRTARCMAELFGYSVDSQVTLLGFGPPIGPSHECQAWMSQSFVDLRSSGGSTPIPITLAEWEHGVPDPAPGRSGLPLETAEPNKGILLERFCSRPIPNFVRLGSAAVGVHVIDAKTLPGEGQGSTIVTAVRRAPFVTPSVSGERFLTVYVRARHPVDRFVCEVYLHRELAIQSVPSAGVYAFSPALSDNPEENWAERLPEALTLQVLAPDFSNSARSAWPRHSEVRRYMFDQFSWKENDFVGYRLEVESPLWGAVYMIALEFPGRPDRSRGGIEPPNA